MPHLTPPESGLSYQNLWIAIGIAHAGTYFVVMAYFSQLYAPLRKRFVIAAALIALGVAIEFIQPYVNRQFDWFDALANCVGVLAAFLMNLSPLGSILRHVDRHLTRVLR